jgi:SAM-dependent methyltransferase
MNAADSGKRYLPAAGHDWLLPLHDLFVKLLGGEAARKTLLDQATIQPGFRVLDIGCGTGTLAILIKRLIPQWMSLGSILIQGRSPERNKKRDVLGYRSR